MKCYSTLESLDYPLDACHIGDCPANHGKRKYRACCNPLHLQWGTHAQNATQREAEARKAQFDFRWIKDPPLGHETHEEHAHWLRSKLGPCSDPSDLNFKSTQEDVDNQLQGISGNFSPTLDGTRTNSPSI